MYGPPSETTFLSSPGVMITSARAVLNGTMYPVANLTSVRLLIEPRPLSRLLWGILLTLAGLPIALAFVWLGLGLAGLGALLLVLYFTSSPKHIVCVATAGAEHNAIWYPKLHDAQAVVGALNQAIVARGYGR